MKLQTTAKEKEVLRAILGVLVLSGNLILIVAGATELRETISDYVVAPAGAIVLGLSSTAIIDYYL